MSDDDTKDPKDENPAEVPVAEDTAELKLDPAYLQAAKDAATHFEFGDVISKNWLYANLDIPDPKLMGKLSKEKHDELSFKFLSAFESFRNRLLEHYAIDLHSVRGIGYRLTKPGEQSGMAMDDMHAGISRQLSKAARRLTFIRHDKLSDAERRENIDAAGQVAALKMMMGSKRYDFRKKQKAKVIP